MLETAPEHMKPHWQEFSLALQSCPMPDSSNVGSIIKTVAFSFVAGLITLLVLAFGVLPRYLDEEDQGKRWPISVAAAVMIMCLVGLGLYLFS